MFLSISHSIYWSSLKLCGYPILRLNLARHAFCCLLHSGFRFISRHRLVESLSSAIFPVFYHHVTRCWTLLSVLFFSAHLFLTIQEAMDVLVIALLGMETSSITIGVDDGTLDVRSPYSQLQTTLWTCGGGFSPDSLCATLLDWRHGYRHQIHQTEVAMEMPLLTRMLTQKWVHRESKARKEPSAKACQVD